MNLTDFDMAGEAPAATGWDALERAREQSPGPRELALAYTRLFTRSAEGATVLHDLQLRTLGRALDHDARGAELRSLEGQRKLVLYILNQVAAGQRPAEEN